MFSDKKRSHLLSQKQGLQVILIYGFGSLKRWLPRDRDALESLDPVGTAQMILEITT